MRGVLSQPLPPPPPPFCGHRLSRYLVVSCCCYAANFCHVRLGATSFQDVLEKDLDQHRRDQRKALSDRLRKRKAAQAEALQRAGAGAEETVAAMKALESDNER